MCYLVLRLYMSFLCITFGNFERKKTLCVRLEKCSRVLLLTKFESYQEPYYFCGVSRILLFLSYLAFSCLSLPFHMLRCWNNITWLDPSTHLESIKSISTVGFESNSHMDKYDLVYKKINLVKDDFTVLQAIKPLKVTHKSKYHLLTV